MSLEVKLCGTTSHFDLGIAERVGADSIGIICVPQAEYSSSRQGSHTVGMDLAAELVEATPQEMTAVLLPRRTSYPHKVEIMVHTVQPDRVQLGESKSPALTEVLRHTFEDTLEIAQVIHVGAFTTPDEIDAFLPSVDMFVLDSYGEQPGGNGVPHDWEISREITRRARDAGKRVLLAGGLNPPNVARAIEIVNPDGVDVESGIKGRFGRHSHRKALDLVSAVRGAEQ